ncbi:MAG: sugar phosphate isomerase/epimerase [Clostridia bacterium]|nr:sugar phosphate isomerase/epimerase [Clostridia bacterium]
MQRIFISELLAPDELREFSKSYGLELIRFSVADTLDRLDPAIQEVDYDCPLTVHGPFLDLNPATWDSAARRVTALRFHQAWCAARALGAEKLVLHTGFMPRANVIEGWAPRAADFFGEFMANHGDLPVALENVLDPFWEPIFEVWRRVRHPDFGLCLDVGHAHCYSLQAATAWAEGLLPALTHVHLHDNHGPRPLDAVADEHLALGEGTLPLKPLMAILGQRSDLTYAIECASTDAVLRSIEALREFGR